MLLNKFLDSTGVSTDTRTVSLGNLFFGLKGDNFDGNQYALEALRNGAKFAIIDDVSLQNTHPNFIFVENSLHALQDLAREYRRYLNKPVIALTGSNGKTTTKELINSVLISKFKVHSTKGNFNNHIGVPLTILSSPREIDFLLIEMGANHQGEIDMLCKIAEPDFGLITNIGKAHLEGFGGIEGVKKGKSELYRYLQANGGTIFCNRSDLTLKDLIPQNAKVIYYDLDVELIENSDYLLFNYKGHEFKTNLFGNHNISNAIAAIEIGLYFDINLPAISSAISNYQPNNNRSQVIISNGMKIIKDAYNSNPSSLKASLNSLIKVYHPDSLVLVLGDMLELGEYSQQEHSNILNFISNHQFKDVWLIGKEFFTFRDFFNYKFFTSVEESKSEFDLQNYGDDTVLFLKGSRGIAVEKIVNS
jgi:UDP-N-acetylmuramoyl-tripeptide--D-alanyl-D-alanine ligase